jgi:TPR repeat protein
MYNAAFTCTTLRRAARLPGSQNNLGSLFETGEGVDQDYVLALFGMSEPNKAETQMHDQISSD